jgi:hypothetical protein
VDEEVEEGTLDCIKMGYNVWTREGLAITGRGKHDFGPWWAKRGGQAACRPPLLIDLVLS